MLTSTRLHVEGMDSAEKIRRISDALVAIQGVADIGVNDEQELVEVKFDPTKTGADSIVSAIRAVGFSASQQG